MRTSTLTFMLCHLEYIPKSAKLSLHCRKCSHKLIATRLLNVIIISEIIVGIIIVIVAATAITVIPSVISAVVIPSVISAVVIQSAASAADLPRYKGLWAKNVKYEYCHKSCNIIYLQNM